ncbi:MAG: GAF domain-containing protein [Candidatus Marinimicrobia bacterium]|nr:GAF domain-containing protein [Candidatus Neomarinimicrobiota bacterium]
MDREKSIFFEELFLSIKKLLSMESSLEEGMQATIDIAKILGIERICIFLKKEESHISLICGHPTDKHGVKNKKRLSEHKGLESIMERKKMIIVKDPSQDPRGGCTFDFCQTHQINASLFVRIEIDKKPIGAIVIDAVGSKKEFSRNDIRIAKAIAMLATKEIHNRRKIERRAKNKIFKLVAETLVHEIRNPLTAIGGFAKRIKPIIDSDPEKVKRYVQIIMNEATRIEKITENSSRLLNRGAIEKKKENFNKLVKDIIEETKKYIPREKKIEIRFNNEKKREYQIYLDGDQIKTALLQIFRNAVDAIDNQGKIFVRIWKRPHFICTEIANTGSHIPADEIETIFTPFYSTKRKDKGMGLGLAISQHIIQEHDGDIEVISQCNPKELTSFTILLPTKK